MCVEVSVCMCLRKLYACAWMCPSEAVGVSLSGGTLCTWADGPGPLLLLLCKKTKK